MPKPASVASPAWACPVKAPNRPPTKTKHARPPPAAMALGRFFADALPISLCFRDRNDTSISNPEIQASPGAWALSYRNDTFIAKAAAQSQRHGIQTSNSSIRLLCQASMKNKCSRTCAIFPLGAPTKKLRGWRSQSTGRCISNTIHSKIKKGNIESMIFRLSKGGICIRSLEGKFRKPFKKRPSQGTQAAPLWTAVFIFPEAWQTMLSSKSGQVSHKVSASSKTIWHTWQNHPLRDGISSGVWCSSYFTKDEDPKNIWLERCQTFAQKNTLSVEKKIHFQPKNWSQSIVEKKADIVSGKWKILMRLQKEFAQHNKAFSKMWPLTNNQFSNMQNLKACFNLPWDAFCWNRFPILVGSSFFYRTFHLKEIPVF